jgi:lysine 2,3-aminomutase
LIDRTDSDDPIARQFIPSPAELERRPEEAPDPIGDLPHSPVPGIVHRYPDRALLKLTPICAVYCRFCFRREMIGPGVKPLSGAELDRALAYIAAQPEIWEVVLTGGDPLVLSARRLKQVMTRLGAIPHVKVIRVHTRVPAVEPARITPELTRALKVADKATYVVLHANHPRELTAKARAACARLIDAGMPMLSQSVLLRGVNDDAQTLGALMRAFVECRIKPYYLHHADLAPGTAHLRTTIAEGQALMRALRGRLSGLCQPSYVLDIPGGHGKSPIGPNYLCEDAPGRYRVEDFGGGTHCYPPPT